MNELNVCQTIDNQYWDFCKVAYNYRIWPHITQVDNVLFSGTVYELKGGGDDSFLYLPSRLGNGTPFKIQTVSCILQRALVCVKYSLGNDWDTCH